MAQVQQQTRISLLSLLDVKVCSRKFSSKYVLFTIFYAYTILVSIHHVYHWVPTHKVK